MKKTLILIGLLSIVVSTGIVSARCVGPIVNGECLGTEVYGSDDDSSEERYSGSSGSSYQYDLNDPKDRNAYSIDLDAQRRDQMSTDPGKSLDEKSGQRGGGIYDD
ncbi:MAG: hypothetical protein K9L30_18520 [Desulfobacterales bacterium]|nr:hypothetical protein [Desulfobacterales bacterium]